MVEDRMDKLSSRSLKWISVSYMFYFLDLLQYWDFVYLGKIVN